MEKSNALCVQSDVRVESIATAETGRDGGAISNSHCAFQVPIQVSDDPDPEPHA